MQLGGRSTRVAVAVAGLVPLASLVFDFTADRLGSNPVETLTDRTGIWAFRMLLLSLAVSPLRRALGVPGLLPYRRIFGLLAFLYASLHFLTYLLFDLDLDLAPLGEDLMERPFIAVGFATLVLLLPLAITSTRGWMRRLGRRWQSLHRLAYGAVVLASVHFLWSAKADMLEPRIYVALAGGLLATRLIGASGRKARKYATIRRAPASVGTMPEPQANPGGPEGTPP